jgi:hypothetical protein
MYKGNITYRAVADAFALSDIYRSADTVLG